METIFSISLPPWLQGLLRSFKPSFPSAEERMKWAIGLSRMNIEHGAGGPFAAAVFEENSDRLIAAGANLVVYSGLSIAHAEITALSLARKTLGKHRLSSHLSERYELYSSGQTCCVRKPPV